MTDRDKVESALINAGIFKYCSNTELTEIACSLIANGVTVADANNATTTWRPASEPPKNGNERVAVFLQDDLITAAIGNNRIDTDRYLDGGWVRWGRFVTHWMPLPNPPKEVE